MSDTNPKHTPLPWEVNESGWAFHRASDRVTLDATPVDADHEPDEEAMANLRHAVECVNSHAALKARCAALEAALAWAQQVIRDMTEPNAFPELKAKMRDALLSPRDGEAK